MSVFDAFNSISDTFCGWVISLVQVGDAVKVSSAKKKPPTIG